MSKRRYILVVIDAFTKFTKLLAVNTPETKIRNYSRPWTIISGRGSCFMSNEFNSFVSQRNIVYVRSSVASPQSNGQVERLNRRS